ncbi:MAG: TVP38/TMEM64 family protein [Clostridiales bacterium]|nr:TVP38/TMEM64 family protein [Clostridiales bacterium]
MDIKKLTKNKVVLYIILAVIIALFVVLYFVMKSNGWLDIFESTQRLQDYVSGFGIWAPVVFMALQVVQVIISPIPGNVTTLAGGVLFGFANGFLLSFVAIFIGSVIAFALARIFGKPLVIKMVGEKITHKYIDVMSSRQKVVLIFMFLLPFFPDDALCLIAGISGISWPFFIVTLLLARPACILFSALVGSGMIQVPVWGWGIIIAFSILIMVLSIRYAPQIDTLAKKHITDRFRKK